MQGKPKKVGKNRHLGRIRSRSWAKAPLRASLYLQLKAQFLILLLGFLLGPIRNVFWRFGSTAPRLSTTQTCEKRFLWLDFAAQPFCKRKSDLSVTNVLTVLM